MDDNLSTSLGLIFNNDSGSTMDPGGGGLCGAPPPQNVTFYNSTSPLAYFYENYFNIHGYLSVCICLFGILANTANIIVLTRKNMITSTTNYILLFLAIADLLTMLDYFPYAMHFYILKDPDLHWPQTRGFGWVCFLLFHASFSIVCHTIAIWLTISLAIFRFICIWFPARGNTYCTVERAKIAIGLIIVLTVIICIPNYISNQKSDIPDCNGTQFVGYVYSIKTLESVTVSKLNYWVQAILIKLIPCFMLTLLTILLITAMHRAYKKRMALKNQGRKTDDSDKHGEQTRTTLMLLAVVVLFLITELPQGILTIISSVIESFFNDVYMPLGDFIDMMTLLNNSINFVLYCSMSKQFRQTFIKTFCSCCPERKHGWRKMGQVGQRNGVSTYTNTTHV